MCHARTCVRVCVGGEGCGCGCVCVCARARVRARACVCVFPRSSICLLTWFAGYGYSQCASKKCKGFHN